MITINPTGVASALTSGTTGAPGTLPASIYFMTGELPAAELLEAIVSEAEFEANFTDIAYKFTGMSIYTTFSYSQQSRTMVKTPIDALKFISEKTGTIGWVAIALSGSYFIFTDSVGLWDDVEANLTVSDLEVVEGDEVIFKDLNMQFRDKSTYELYPNGIFAQE